MSKADSRPFKPVVFGCAGAALTEDERALFADARPLGLIVFARNCVGRAQLTSLIESFREIVDDELAPVFVDEEGGRVQRLKAPTWWSAPAPGLIGAAAANDLPAAEALARAVGRGIGAKLAEVGVTVDFAPCLDVAFPYTHDAIGDRAFSSDPAVVAALGRAYAEGLADLGVQATIKHLPGHGRARLDSHYDLPVIDASEDDLEIDLAPFIALKNLPWGMVSHLLFPALDPDEPATTSAKIIAELIRGRIGFEGVLCTDDISMKALKAPVEVSSRRALDAGCDLVVHCNAEMAEMRAIAEAVPAMSDKLRAKLEAIATPAKPSPDPNALYAAVDGALLRGLA
jgi:beta-N-acetylhexosaminidase